MTNCCYQKCSCTIDCVCNSEAIAAGRTIIIAVEPFFQEIPARLIIMPGYHFECIGTHRCPQLRVRTGMFMWTSGRWFRRRTGPVGNGC